MSSTDSLVPERPLQFGDMIRATYSYMRRNPAATLGVGALLATVTSSVQGVVVNGIVFGSNRGAELQRLIAGDTLSTKQLQAAIDEISGIAPYLALAGAVQSIVQFAAMGVMTLGMVQAMAGSAVHPAALWRQVPWRRILGINVIVFALICLVVGIPLAGALALGGAAAAVLLGFGVVFAFVLAILSTLAVPASVIDQLGVRASLRRTLAVTRRAFLRTAALVIASLMFWTLLGDLIGSPVGRLMGGLAGGSGSVAGDALSMIVAGIVGGAITLPASSAMAVLIYVDRTRRMRPAVS